MFPIRPKGYIKSLSPCHHHSLFLLTLWLSAEEWKLFHFSKEEDESRLKDNERLCIPFIFYSQLSAATFKWIDLCIYFFGEQIKGRGYDAYHHLRSHHLSLRTLPLFPLSLKNEARNCCDVLRNCFLKTMLQNCCAISLYRRIRAGNSITAALDLFTTHTLKKVCGEGKKNVPVSWTVKKAMKRELPAILSEK